MRKVRSQKLDVSARDGRSRSERARLNPVGYTECTAPQRLDSVDRNRVGPDAFDLRAHCLQAMTKVLHFPRAAFSNVVRPFASAAAMRFSVAPTETNGKTT